MDFSVIKRLTGTWEIMKIKAESLNIQLVTKCSNATLAELLDLLVHRGSLHMNCKHLLPKLVMFYVVIISSAIGKPLSMRLIGILMRVQGEIVPLHEMRETDN